MLKRAFKALNAIFIQGQTQRIWQIANKTPLIALVSWTRRLFYQNIERNRVLAFRQISGETSHEVKQALDHLEKYGYTAVNNLIQPEDLKRIDQFIEEKKKKAQEIQAAQVVKTKDFWVRLSDDDLSKGLTTENPLVRISLEENILQLAGHYLGQIPFLEYVLLTMSLPSKKPLQSSQLWHLDRDNDRMLKFFIYFSDVDEIGDGPFTFIPADESKKVKNSFVLKHLPDDQVFNTIDPKCVTQMYGKKWTAFVCDTSRCYHMGSRLNEGHERLMTTSLYIALPSIYPSQGKTLIQATTPLTPIQKIAISPLAH